MHIPVHSPWLPGYTDVAQDILIILRVVRLFLGRPCIHIKIYTHMNIYININVYINSFMTHNNTVKYMT